MNIKTQCRWYMIYMHTPSFYSYFVNIKYRAANSCKILSVTTKQFWKVPIQLIIVLYAHDILTPFENPLGIDTFIVIGLWRNKTRQVCVNMLQFVDIMRCYAIILSFYCIGSCAGSECLHNKPYLYKFTINNLPGCYKHLSVVLASECALQHVTLHDPGSL